MNTQFMEREELISYIEQLEAELKVYRSKKKTGRKTVITEKVIEEIKRMRSDGETYENISWETKLGVGTVYKAAQMIKEKRT